LVKLAIVRALVLEIVHPLCPQAAIVQALARVRIGLRLDHLAERVPAVALPRIGRRLDHPAERVPVEVQRQTGLRLDPRVAGEQIKLGIAAFRRVREAAGHLAVAVEILRARAARGAAAAWAAVDSAAVVAVAVAAVAVAAAVEDGVDEEPRNEIKNKSYEFFEILYDRCSNHHIQCRCSHFPRGGAKKRIDGSDCAAGSKAIQYAEGSGRQSDPGGWRV
jgi:hypothetical protein